MASVGEGFFIRTSRGIIPRNILKPVSRDGTGTDILATDRGSRIGVLFVPTVQDPNRAEMHFIINGQDQGPCTKDIPYKEGALHAVVDVYGTTKQVRVIQLYGSKWFSYDHTVTDSQMDTDSYLLGFVFQYPHCRVHVAMRY